MTRQQNIWCRRFLDLSPLILLVILLAIFALIDARIVSTASLINIVAQATPIAILALGALIVLL
ncbi:hypothetical protein EN939_37800, partial [Mesorhizobium sp. M7A.F.Ca.CA.002.05.1.1]